MQPYFLVCVNFALVATDIVETLEDMGLGKPVVAGSEGEALPLLAALPPGAPLRLAVVEAAPQAFATSLLQATLDAMGAKVVLISDTTEPAPEPRRYPLLPKPFFTDDLIRLLAGCRLA